MNKNKLEKHMPLLASHVKRWVKDLEFKSIEQILKHIESDSWIYTLRELSDDIGLEKEILVQIEQFRENPSFNFYLKNKFISDYYTNCDTDYYNQLAKQLRKKHKKHKTTWEELIYETDEMRDPFAHYISQDFSSLCRALDREIQWMQDPENQAIILN